MPLEFVITSLIVCAIPGIGVIYTISHALAGGFCRGILAAIGCTLGVAPHVLAAVLGLSGLMQTGATAFEVVRWAGVAYLVFIGVSMLRSGVIHLDASEATTVARSGRSIVGRAIPLNLLNPKLTIFFFAFLQQFVAPNAGILDPHLAVLGGAFMLMTFVVFAAYAWSAAAARAFILGAPRVRLWIQRAMGTIVVGFAARLATER